MMYVGLLVLLIGVVVVFGFQYKCYLSRQGK
jgi:hypothetical protein